MAKRPNPTAQPGHTKALSQSVVHPLASDENTSGGNPAKLKVPAAKSKTLNQKVSNPVASRKMNMTGAKGAC